MPEPPGDPVRPSSFQGYDGWSLPVVSPSAGIRDPSSIRSAGGCEQEGQTSLHWLEGARVAGQHRRVLAPAGVDGQTPSFSFNEMRSAEMAAEISSDVMDQSGGFTGLITRGIFSEASLASEPATTALQADDVVLSSVQTNQKRSKNFSVDEDETLVSAWLNVSLDPIQGVDQSRTTYWKRIYDYFHAKKTFISTRSQSSLMNRWSTIQHDVNVFAGCVSRIEARNQSGLSIDDKQANALKMFKSEDSHNRNFPFMHCWKILKNHSKWADKRKHIETQKATTKKQKTTTNSSAGTSLSLVPAGKGASTAVGVDGQPTCTLERPAGKKKEKEKLRHQSGIAALDYLMAKKKEADADKELKKEERSKKAFALEEERISLEKKKFELDREKFELEREKHEDSIMCLDLSTMSAQQQEYYLSRQEQILARRLNY